MAEQPINTPVRCTRSSVTLNQTDTSETSIELLDSTTGILRSQSSRKNSQSSGEVLAVRAGVPVFNCGSPERLS